MYFQTNALDYINVDQWNLIICKRGENVANIYSYGKDETAFMEYDLQSAYM